MTATKTMPEHMKWKLPDYLPLPYGPIAEMPREAGVMTRNRPKCKTHWFKRDYARQGYVCADCGEFVSEQERLINEPRGVFTTLVHDPNAARQERAIRQFNESLTWPMDGHYAQVIGRGFFTRRIRAWLEGWRGGRAVINRFAARVNA